MQLSNITPEDIKAGSTIDIQIAPHGDYPGIMEDPNAEMPVRVVQRLLPETLRKVADRFEAEILVDRDHDSENGGSTEALGWITALHHDDADGLIATVALTDLGADAIRNRRFRFVSPVFEVDRDSASNDRTPAMLPVRLLSLALTNKPNLPVRCVLNRADGANNTTPVEGRSNDMEQIIEILGLPAEADNDAIVAAIKALQALAEAQAEAIKAEAKTVADENEDKIANRAEFIKLYVANRDAAKALIATIKAPTRVVNAAAAAKQPSFARRDASTDVLTIYNSLDGEAKRAYLRQHAIEIDRARKAASQA